MGFHAAQQGTEAVAQEKTDGQPGGVGGEAQQIKIPVRVQQCLIELDAAPGQQIFDRRAELLFGVILGLGAEKEAGRMCGIDLREKL